MCGGGGMNQTLNKIDPLGGYIAQRDPMGNMLEDAYQAGNWGEPYGKDKSGWDVLGAGLTGKAGITGSADESRDRGYGRAFGTAAAGYGAGAAMGATGSGAGAAEGAGAGATEGAASYGGSGAASTGGTLGGGTAPAGYAAGDLGSGLQATGSTASNFGGTYAAEGGGAQGAGLSLSPGTTEALGAGSGVANNFGGYYGSGGPTGGGAAGGSTGAGTGNGLQLSQGTSQSLGVNSGGGAAPSSGGAAGSAGGGSGSSIVDSILAQMKNNAVGLGLSALSTAAGARQHGMPNQQQQQAGGEAANALGVEFLNQARAGNLMPWQQSGLDQYTQNAKNQINQYFASIGQFDSTARMQALAQVDQQSQIMRGQLLQQTLSSGLSALGAAQGPFNTIANYQLQQDKQLQEAMGNFARSVGTMYGGQAGRTQQPAQGGGSAATTNASPQPYITNSTDPNIPAQS